MTPNKRFLRMYYVSIVIIITGLLTSCAIDLDGDFNLSDLDISGSFEVELDGVTYVFDLDYDDSGKVTVRSNIDRQELSSFVSSVLESEPAVTDSDGLSDEYVLYEEDFDSFEEFEAYLQGLTQDDNESIILPRARGTVNPSQYQVTDSREVTNFIQESQPSDIDVSRSTQDLLGRTQIADFATSQDLDFPTEPSDPQNPRGFFGRNIIGQAIFAPDWTFDATNTTDLFGYELTAKQAGDGLYSLSFSIDSNLSATRNGNGAVNGIVFQTAYILNEKQEQWIEFNLSGTRVQDTGWLRHSGSYNALVNPATLTDNDYLVLLAYQCLKFMGGLEWECNDGKWVLFVVELGDVVYTAPVMQTDGEKYQDLDLTDIVKLYEQLGLSLELIRPELYDVALHTPKVNYTVAINETVTLDFGVHNLGNRDVSDLTFYFDIGEQVLADVVSVQLPDNIPAGESSQGSVTLKLKEQGRFSFPLFVKIPEVEVDTSDNLIHYSIQVGEPLQPRIAQDTLMPDYNRDITWARREETTTRSFEGSQLLVTSGTTVMRTIHGGYFEGLSINPTMQVLVEPQLVLEAIGRYPFVSTIMIENDMITGDREVVEYYVAIENLKTGETYSTPVLESMYTYYFFPHDLIPNFEFCTDYASRIVVVSDNMETIDLIDPEVFNVCGFNINLGAISVGTIEKEDGYYFGFSTDFLSKLFFDQEYSYNVTVRNSRNRQVTLGPIHSSQGYVQYSVNELFGNINPVSLDWTYEVELLDTVLPYEYDSLVQSDNAFRFEWRGWTVTQGLSGRFEFKRGEIRITIDPRVSFREVLTTELLGFSQLFGDTEPYPFSFSFFDMRASGIDTSFRNIIYSNTQLEFQLFNLNTGVLVAKTNHNDLTSGPSIQRQVISNLLYDESDNLILESGTMYQIRVSVISPIYRDRFSISYDSRNEGMFYYVDGPRLLMNKPLLRTQFFGLQNVPTSLFTTVEDGIPSILVQYKPADAFVREDGSLSVLGNRRLYSPQEVLMFKFAERETNLHPYELTITLTPYDISEQRLQQEFNCKLGRFDLLCNRGYQIYRVVYFDEVHGLSYTIGLRNNNNHVFLKRYRDTPEVLDGIIYDILTEIERNPIRNFDIDTMYEITPRELPSYLSLYSSYGLLGRNLKMEYAAHISYTRTPIDLHVQLHTPYNIHTYTIYYDMLQEFMIRNYENLGFIKDGERQISCYVSMNCKFSPEFVSSQSEIDFSQIPVIREENGIIHYDLREFIALYARNDIDNEFENLFALKDFVGIDSVGMGRLNNLSFFIADLSSTEKRFMINSLGLDAFLSAYKILIDDYIAKNNLDVTHIEASFDLELLTRPAERFGSIFLRMAHLYRNSFLVPIKQIYEDRSAFELLEEYSHKVPKPAQQNAILLNSDSVITMRDMSTGLKMFPDLSIFQPTRVRSFFSGGQFEAIFILDSSYDGIVRDELTVEEIFEQSVSRHIPQGDQFIRWNINQYDDYYVYLRRVPVRQTTLDTSFEDISCQNRFNFNHLPQEFRQPTLNVICQWTNINTQEIYTVDMTTHFPGYSLAQMNSLSESDQNYVRNFVEETLAFYLERFPPTPLPSTRYN